MALENLVLSLKVDRIVKSLFVTILVLSMASLTALGLRFYGGYEYAYGFVQLFAVDMEGNIPTYFSSLLHLSSALLISLIAFDARQKGSADRVKWTGMAAIFLFLSMDEASSMHELLTYPMRELLGTSGILYFAWVVPAMIILIILAGIYWPFLRRLPKETFRGFLLAAFVFLSGAILMEFVGGWLAEQQGVDHLEFGMATEVEEVLEMTGVVIFIRTLLIYLNKHVDSLGISFER